MKYATGPDSRLEGADMEAAVDLVYENAVLKGYNPNANSNHELMDTIKLFDLADEQAWQCWMRLWEKHRDELSDLGYKPGW